MANLRPYQQRGIESVRSSFAAGNRRVCFYLPTGGGKTVVAQSIIDMALAKGTRVAFVCNRIELVRQTSTRFHAAGIDHGIMQGENTQRIHSPVMICSIQTLNRRRLQDFGLIIIDEAHGVAGSTAYRNLLFALNRVPVVGLTATPFAKGMSKHYDELRGPLFQDLVIAGTIQELIGSGNLVDVEIYAPEAYQPDLSSVRIVAGDYEESELAQAVDKPRLIGDIVSHWRKLGRGKPTIVFATNIAHSKHIVAQFVAAGIAAEHIDYLTPEEDRIAILDRVRSGQTTIISNSAMLAEGLDIPQLEVMILARPTKSLIRYIQQAGRILRPAEGKARALILDHSGTCAKLGFPTDDLPLELDDGKPKKSEGKTREKLPSVCSGCGVLKQPGEHECHACGFKPERKSDVEVGDGELKPMARKDRDAMPMEAKQAIYSALIGWVKSKGKNPGWAFHLYFDMMGANVPSKLEKKEGPMVESVQNWLTHRNIAYANRKKKEEASKAIKCPKCAGSDYRTSAGVGPHAMRADCNACGAMWWLSKEARRA